MSIDDSGIDDSAGNGTPDTGTEGEKSQMEICEELHAGLCGGAKSDYTAKCMADPEYFECPN